MVKWLWHLYFKKGYLLILPCFAFPVCRRAFSRPVLRILQAGRSPDAEGEAWSRHSGRALARMRRRKKSGTIKKCELFGDIADILNGLPDTRQFELAEKAGATTYGFIQPNHLGVFNDIQDALEIKRQTPVDDSYLIRRNDILLKHLRSGYGNTDKRGCIKYNFFQQSFCYSCNQ